MIKVSVLNEGVVQAGGTELLDAPGSARWIDVENTDAEELGELGRRFGLHKLAVEDCLHQDQRPKLEEYPNHLFLVLNGFTHEAADICELTLHEHHFFIGPTWIISVHALPFSGVQNVWRRVQDDPAATLGRGPDFIAYLVADALVDQSFPILDHLNDELENLEVEIFERPESGQLQRIFALKRMLVHFRRVLSPQRDVVSLLSREGLPHLGQRNVIYFRDIYDHLVRVYEQIDSGRDLLGNAMDGYLSMVANRTNDITKQLTIFSTIFLPLSFITGFFGQNFDVLSGAGFFWLMMSTVVALPVGLIVWFRRKGWF